MDLISSAFREGTTIPARFTCDNINVSPPLEWTEGPSGTKSYALICEDPDAPRGTWVHWIIFNIPATTHELPENVPATESLNNGARQGMTDFGSVGYGGPCPPSGTHRYYFKIYALDFVLDHTGPITRKELLGAIGKHILDEGQLMGRYKRSS